MRILLLLIALLTLTGTALSAQGSVFPGDANRDGIVDHHDILPIGFAYGNLGPTRDVSNNQGTQPYQTNWPGVFPSGTNYIHADVNGNGLIDILDFITLAQNQGLTNNNGDASFEVSSSPSSASPLIRIGGGEELVPDDIAGQTISIPVSMDQNADTSSVNGLAFALNYNQDIVSSATFTFADEWLGAAGQAFRFQRDEAGSVRIALTRFGSNSVNGNGRIGTLELVIIEDLVGFLPTTPGAGVTVASVEGAEAVDGDFEQIPTNEGELVTQPVNALLASNDREENIAAILTTISPNPTEANVTVTCQQTFNQIELIDLTGRIQQLYDGPNLLTWTGRVDNQPAGLYYLRTRGKAGISVTPLIIN